MSLVSELHMTLAYANNQRGLRTALVMQVKEYTPEFQVSNNGKLVFSSLEYPLAATRYELEVSKQYGDRNG